MTPSIRRILVFGAAASLALGTAACGSTATTATPGGSSNGGSGTTAPSSGATSSAGSLDVNTFISGGEQAAWDKLAAFKSMLSGGSGKIAVLLPDTQSSDRWANKDAPGFKAAFKAMGIPDSDVIVENAQNSATTQQTQAEQAMTNGAKVIILTALDSGSGASIEKAAKEQGVAVIDYDRLVLNGSAGYYVSFDNTQVGRLQGQGLVDCIQSWNVKNPHVYEVDGSPDDNNATLFANGYNEVLKPKYASGDYKKVGEQAVPGWDNQKAQTLFEQAYQAHPDINSVVVANDGMANAVIQVLKNQSIKPKTVPTTGQDATVQGLQNILAGYQCMTVYKPIYAEVAATAAIAGLLRAGQTPPAALVNGKVNNKSADVPSVLLKPISVNASNINTTVIADNFVKASDLCKGDLQAACTQAGISG